MPKKTKKIIIISVVIGIVLFLATGIVLFVLMGGNGNSALSLRMILGSNRYSDEEKLEYAHRYIHNFATQIDSELHMMEYSYDHEDENWDYSENGTKVDVSGIEIPRYIRVEEVCKGDIGNDGIEDMAIIYGLYVNLSHNKVYDAEETRIVCVYRQNENGIYEYWQENRTMICNDWYNDVDFNNRDYNVFITDGELYCTLADGSLVEDCYCFDLHDGNLVMTGFQQSWWESYVDLIGGYIYRYQDYENGTLEVCARGTGIDNTNIKICEERFDPFLVAFEDVERSIIYISPEFQGYLPVMYKLENSNNLIHLHASEWSIRPENNGAKILDYIKDTYYPNMVRVEMGYSDEVIANNVELLGYVFPTYYYQDAQGNRLYFCDMYPYGIWNGVQQDCIIHIIEYEYSDGSSHRYKVEDASLETEVSTYRL